MIMLNVGTVIAWNNLAYAVICCTCTGLFQFILNAADNTRRGKVAFRIARVFTIHFPGKEVQDLTSMLFAHRTVNCNKEFYTF